MMPSLSSSQSSAATMGDSTQKTGGVSFGAVTFKGTSSDSRSMPGSSEAGGGSSGVPVWVWVAGGAAVLVGGFLLFRHLKK